jgi:hypothetical protein
MASVASTYDLDLMSEKLPRSPHDIVGGLVYFPRMLDQIRLHARGDLPEAYHNNLGREFDGHCLAFLHASTLSCASGCSPASPDEEILEWWRGGRTTRRPAGTFDFH